MMGYDFNEVATAPARYDLRDIEERLRASAASWLPGYYPNGRLSRDRSEIRCADISGRAPRKEGSCTIRVAGELAGTAYDFDGGAFYSAIDIIGYNENLSGMALFERVAQMTGASHHGDATAPASRPAKAPPAPKDDTRTKAEIDFILSHCEPAAGTMVETYLGTRGLTLPASDDILFHPDLADRGGTNRGWPAMVGRIRRGDGTETGGIHRTFLADDGTDKAGLEKDKRMWGPVVGGGVWMGDQAATDIAIGEGIETTASGMAIFGVARGCAALSTSGMETVSWPASTTAVLILADAGKAGDDAARVLAGRLQAAGVPHRVMRPVGNDDFNTDLRAGRTAQDYQAKVSQIATPSPPIARPRIIVARGQFASVADQAEAALIASGMAIFHRGGMMVRPVAEDVVAARGAMTTVVKLREMSRDEIRDAMSRTADFGRYDKDGRWSPEDPKIEIAGALATREGMWKVPGCIGVITTPTLRPDGSLLSSPGYDAATRLYFDPDKHLTLPEMPSSPTREDAEAALLAIKSLLIGFPFVGDVDRAVALSGILTIVVRGAMTTAPMHAIRASTPGSGKSYLVDLASLVATGRKCPVISVGKTEEETEKRLGSMLLAGVSIVSVDNVNGDLGGDMLCQMTERPLVRVRILGQSKMPEIEVRSTIFATGNNITLLGDMTRRAILCSLDAGVERPEMRSFAFDPAAEVYRNRGRYVAAALTVVRAYLAAGRPGRLKPIGSYEEWSDLVRSALVWLGEADPVASMDAARAEDPILQQLRELYAEWASTIGLGKPMQARELIETAQKRSIGDYDRMLHPDFYDALVRFGSVGVGAQLSSKSLGRRLSKFNGRIVDGVRLDHHVAHGGGLRFVLTAADG